jgi:hypothetical protein
LAGGRAGVNEAEQERDAKSGPAKAPYRSAAIEALAYPCVAYR